MTTPRRLRVRVIPGAFAICRLDSRATVPVSMGAGQLLSVTRTASELSIVCEEQSVPEGSRCEKGWRCLVVEGPLAFTATGILASLAGPLAEAGVSIFAVSTFDTDYILVPDERISRALEALTTAGHDVSE
jgi:hypothetical protein